MKPSIVAKLEALHERHEEVQALLGDAGTIADQERFRALSREYAQLSDVSKCFTDWRQVQEDIETAQMMLDDPEMREMAQEELQHAKARSEEMEQQLQVLLLPKDPDDERNAFVVRAGTGGDEGRCSPEICSCRTAGMPNCRWRGDHERQRRRAWRQKVIAKISGDGVYGRLSLNPAVTACSACLRQTRRIHTSACTGGGDAGLPRRTADINPADLRTTPSAHRAGGQHVNTTDSLSYYSPAHRDCG
ncbi:MAG: PCRF domain-containing protein [Enterobacter hormaechei]